MPKNLKFDQLGFCPAVYHASHDVQLRAMLETGDSTLPETVYQEMEDGTLRVSITMPTGTAFEQFVPADQWWYQEPAQPDQPE
jgi:hypothetical protein